MDARLKSYYRSDVAPALMKKFEYKSVMQIPKLDKVVVNVGVGEAKENAKAVDAACNDLAIITKLSNPVVLNSEEFIKAIRETLEASL